MDHYNQITNGTQTIAGGAGADGAAITLPLQGEVPFQSPPLSGFGPSPSGAVRSDRFQLPRRRLPGLLAVAVIGSGVGFAAWSSFHSHLAPSDGVTIAQADKSFKSAAPAAARRAEPVMDEAAPEATPTTTPTATSTAAPATPTAAPVLQAAPPARQALTAATPAARQTTQAAPAAAVQPIVHQRMAGVAPGYTAPTLLTPAPLQAPPLREQADSAPLAPTSAPPVAAPTVVETPAAPPVDPSTPAAPR